MSKLQEEWKFYKETYSKKFGLITWEVSNYGRVKRNGIIYICRIHKLQGYYYLCNQPLHRIIAEKFLPNPYNLPCVDHIDTNRLNNMVSNLRWCTYKTNNNNPITKQHQSKAKIGKTLSEEHKKKISETKRKKRA